MHCINTYFVRIITLLTKKNLDHRIINQLLFVIEVIINNAFFWCLLKSIFL